MIALRDAAMQLQESGVPSPEHDAVALAAHVMGVSVAEVRRRVVLDGVTFDGDDADRYAALLAERARRVPLQHLTGTTGFRTLELEVGPGVFVPRPETELVAGWAIDAAQAAADRTDVDEVVVVDLCTGSGAIALAVAAEVPRARVVGVEISDQAMAWAMRNRDASALPLDLVHADATTACADLEGLVDVVVSNPPYIPIGAVPVDPEVRDHDPEVALYGGSEDGLAIPLRVAARAAQLLRPGGVLVMEHAHTQGQSLPRALAATGSWVEIEDRLDLTGRPRATLARRV